MVFLVLDFAYLNIKGYDEDGFYQAFSQRVGGGVIPIKTNRNLSLLSRKSKSLSSRGFRVCYVSA